MGSLPLVNLGVTLISNMISSIRAKFLITASCLFLQAVCQDRQYDYEYENSPSSEEFGAPSRPTTTDPTPPSQPPYLLMNSTSVPFNSTARPQLTSSTTESSTTTELEVVYVYEWINSTSVPTNSTARPEITSTTIAGSTSPVLVPFLITGEKKRRRKICGKLPKARSIKIYECDTWAMRCEYRPSKETEYNLHCKVVPSGSERNRISSEFF